MNQDALKELLDTSYERYNVPEFIADDPISIPHQFDKKEDIEIAAFLSAVIAWGNRKSIIRNANLLMKEMGYFPHEFILNATENDFQAFNHFVHRTFNGNDAKFFLQSLQNIYRQHKGLETVFTDGYRAGGSLFDALIHFRSIFLSLPHLKRSEKHVANVAQKSAAKRLCMFLRWMVRDDGRGVDFGLWHGIPASALMMPLDVHTGSVSRELGLLRRNQNDWQSVEELTATLRQFDPRDPVKYDFALFGLGIDKML
ncbi:MAG: TIGR02757 family protein [Prolixibacteraceae bacterium]|nr:TIGR02757 family protein [Prolixibacteraceae bacterium]MBN2650426.1 TIGR02757 family protein [Prolixibacteraceae bacterium]